MAVDICKATVSDHDDIMALTALMHAEAPRFTGHSFSVDKASQLIRWLIESHVIIIAKKDDRAIGFCAGTLTEQFLSHDKTASDIGVFVLPEYRGGRTFIRLVNAFEAWAWDNGAIEVCMGVSTGIHTDVTVRMYERMGYRIGSIGLIKSEV